jgi:hypothetical protein
MSVFLGIARLIARGSSIVFLALALVHPGAGAAGNTTSAASESARSGHPHVGIGISRIAYWDGSHAYADLARHGQLRTANWDDYAVADANGAPTSDFKFIVSSNNLAGGTYKLAITGKVAVIGPSAGMVRNTQYSPEKNTTTAEWTLASSEAGNVWLDFTGTSRDNRGSAAGVTDIHIWRPGYPTDGSVMFTNEFVRALARFRIIRGMDFVRANSNGQAHWSERTLPSHIGDTGSNGQAWECLIALANATNADVWLNIPARADNDYIEKLAQLVRFGSDGVNPYNAAQANPRYAPLKATLKVYTEYGNEIWNSGAGFNGFDWALTLAKANMGNTGHPIAWDGPERDQYGALKRWVAFRSAGIGLIFKRVFSGNTARVRPILAAQAGDANIYLSSGLLWADAFFGAPRTAPLWDTRYWGAPTVLSVRDIWYGGGGAAYYDSDAGAPTLSNMQAYFQGLPESDFGPDVAIDALWTHAFGLKLVAYEGGPQPGGSALGDVDSTVVAKAYNNNKGIQAPMLRAQSLWEANGGDEFVYYVYSASPPWNFVNDAAPNTVSDTDTVKLRAIDSMLAGNIAEATLGTAVPASFNVKAKSASVLGTYDDLSAFPNGSTMYRLTAAHRGYVLIPVRAAADAAFRLTLEVPRASGNGQLQVYVNGVAAGSIAVPDRQGNGLTRTAPLPVQLPQGLSVIRIVAGSGDVFIANVSLQ